MVTIEDKKPGINKKVIIGLVIAFAVLVVALVTGYFICDYYYGSHFMKGTIVNGIDVSKMSMKELNDKVQDYTLTIVERTSDGDYEEETIKGSQMGLKLCKDSGLQKILDDQQGGKWLFGKGKEYTMDELTEYDQDAWQELLDSLMCFADDFITSPENAYVAPYDEKKNTFELVEEVQGNEAVRDRVDEVLSKAVSKLDKTVNLEDEDCYEKPEVTVDNEDIQAFYKKLKQYAGEHITYTFGDDVEELTGEDICKWLIIDYDNYTVSLNSENVTEYVSYLRWKYDTIFGTREFQTSYGQTVTIEGGDYGWWMNKEEEIAGLTAMIEAGESGDRTPVYYQEAAQYGENDYGNTYVEINLTAQHLFLYVDGEKKLESDFVSGNAATGHSTPAGTYAVTYTERYAILRGDTYETMVSYWMPFNEDIGLHDATWKYEFGSQFYQHAGSHGCVNLPYGVAKEIFGYLQKGMPVICYHLPGTESTSVTLQTEEEMAQSVIDAINEIPTASNKKNQTENARMLYNDLNRAAKAKVTNYNELITYESQYE